MNKGAFAVLLKKNLLNEKLNEWLSECIKFGDISGAGVHIMQNGETVSELYCGFADMDLKIPIRSESMYRLASMTKPVTAIAVMICVERGLISLDDSLSKYIPDFKRAYVGEWKNNRVVKKEKAEDIKLIHLMTHSSGLGSGIIGEKVYAGLPKLSKTGLREVVEYYASNPVVEFQPGTFASYSPRMGFDVLARIVELVSKKSYTEFIRQEIFEPLDISDITPLPSGEQWRRTVKMHHKCENGTGYTDNYLDRCIFEGNTEAYHCGGACLLGTVKEYSSLAQMLVCGGEYNGKRILTAESVRKMAEPYFPQNGEKFYAMGMRTVVDDLFMPKGSFGWSGAYGTHFWVDPVNNITVVFMKNSIYDGGANAKTARMLERIVYTSICEEE